MGPNPLTEREQVLVWALTCALSHVSTQSKYSDVELRRCVVILDRIVERDDEDGAKVINLNDYSRSRRVRTPGDDDGDGRQ